EPQAVQSAQFGIALRKPRWRAVLGGFEGGPRLVAAPEIGGAADVDRDAAALPDPVAVALAEYAGRHQRHRARRLVAEFVAQAVMDIGEMRNGGSLAGIFA